MNLMYIIQETALMMGFTFIVGIAFAYVLKGMTFSSPASVVRGFRYGWGEAGYGPAPIV